ncbi:MAG: hypothetical protein PVG07_05005 [Acidobacteriota bacterium]
MIRRVVGLALVVGLLAAPAAMADRGWDREEPQGFFASIDQLVQNLMAEVGGWFESAYDATYDATLGPIALDPTDPSDPLGGGPGATTDSGPDPDPDG